MTKLSLEVERAVGRQAALPVAVEDDGHTLTITGLIASDLEREAILEIAAGMAQGRELIDNLELNEVLPAEIDGLELSEAGTDSFPGADEGYDSNGPALEPGDFTGQPILDSPQFAAGPNMSIEYDEVSEGDEAWVPPIDPVAARGPRGETEIIGGLELDSMESIDVPRSALDGRYGDEAIADAIRRELTEDAATTDLVVDVSVFRGVATLRGTVPELYDAENAEEVAARVPGVVEVREELQVENYGEL